MLNCLIDYHNILDHALMSLFGTILLLYTAPCMILCTYILCKLESNWPVGIAIVTTIAANLSVLKMKFAITLMLLFSAAFFEKGLSKLIYVQFVMYIMHMRATALQ